MKVKSTRGITLVALVVTIVIMLILAGVSLNVILGDQGILKKAKDGADRTRVEAIKEGKMLYETEKYMGETSGSLLDYLESNGLIDAEERAEIEATNKLVIGDYTISFAKTLVQAFKDEELQVGDYVNYTPIAGTQYPSLTNENGWADQTYTVDSEIKWRVLGLNASETQLVLISGTPIKKDMDASSTNEWDKDPYLYMKGAYSYENCEEMLDNICGIYSNSLGTAKSIRIEDINNALGVVVEGNTVYVKGDASKTNIDVGGVLGNSYTYTRDDYSPASYINGKQHATAGEKENYSTYGYIGAGLNASDTLKNMLFSGTTPDSNFAKSYWLASPGSFGNGSYAAFGPGAVFIGRAYRGFDGLFDSASGWRAYRLAVRPVVYLKSDITVDDVSKIETAVTEPDWSTYDNSIFDVAGGNAINGEAGNHGE